MWKVLVIVGLFSVSFVDGKYQISKQRAEQIRREATWVPYTYDNHPFRDEEDLTKRTGLIQIENQPSTTNHLLSNMLKTFKTFKMGGVKKSGNPIFKDHQRHQALGLPTSFDSRVKWPTCIHGVRD